jgi:hypothetical protein
VPDCWVFAALPGVRVARFEEDRCGPVERYEPLHVVDKFWDPDPLVALVIDPGRSSPSEGAEIFMPSMSLSAQDRLFQAPRSPLSVARDASCTGSSPPTQSGKCRTGTVVKLRCPGL